MVKLFDLFNKPYYTNVVLPEPPALICQVEPKIPEYIKFLKKEDNEMINKEIIIIGEDNEIIKYAIADILDRKELAMVESEIEIIKARIASDNAKLIELEEKIQFAKQVVALADEKKRIEQPIAEVAMN